MEREATSGIWALHWHWCSPCLGLGLTSPWPSSVGLDFRFNFVALVLYSVDSCMHCMAMYCIVRNPAFGCFMNKINLISLYRYLFKLLSDQLTGKMCYRGWRHESSCFAVLQPDADRKRSERTAEFPRRSVWLSTPSVHVSGISRAKAIETVDSVAVLGWRRECRALGPSIDPAPDFSDDKWFVKPWKAAIYVKSAQYFSVLLLLMGTSSPDRLQRLCPWIPLTKNRTMTRQVSQIFATTSL